MPPTYKPQMPLEFIQTYENYRSMLVESDKPLQFKESITFEEQIAYILNTLLIHERSTTALRSAIEYLAQELDKHKITIKKYRTETIFVNLSTAINAGRIWKIARLENNIVAIFIGLGNYFLNQEQGAHVLLAETGITKILVNHLFIEQKPKIQDAVIRALASLISKSDVHLKVIRSSNLDMVNILLPFLKSETATNATREHAVFILAAFVDDLIKDTEINESINTLKIIKELAINPVHANKDFFIENVAWILISCMRSQQTTCRQAATVILNDLQLINPKYKIEIKNQDITDLLLYLFTSTREQISAQIAATCILAEMPDLFSSFTTEQKNTLLGVIYSQLEFNPENAIPDKLHQTVRIVCRLTEIDKTLISFYEAILPLLMQLAKTHVPVESFQDNLSFAIKNTLDCVLSYKTIDTKDISDFLNSKLKERLNGPCTINYTRALTILNKSVNGAALILNSRQATTIIASVQNISLENSALDQTYHMQIVKKSG